MFPCPFVECVPLKTILVLGTGCAACRRLAADVSQAAKDLGVDHSLEKVGDMGRILSFDVPGLPALVIDGEVRSTGRVPSMNELRGFLQ